MYRLGATLHQLLSGNDPSQTPFQFTPLLLRNSSVSTELEHLIRQMVELDANKRPASIKAVKKELQRLATEEKAWKIRTPQSILPANIPSPSGISQVSQHPIRQLQTTKVLPLATPLYTYMGIPHLYQLRYGRPMANVSRPQAMTILYRSGMPSTGHKHDDWVTSVAWSADGQFIASGSADGVVQVWKALINSRNAVSI